MPNLAVSLHATTDEQRTALVPPNRKYPLAAILDVVPELSPQETQSHHVRVRAAGRGERHSAGCAPPGANCWRESRRRST